MIQRILNEKCLITSDAPIIVAVSGGHDSLCLLDLLWRLGYPLTIAHFDHALRPESSIEADKVRLLSQRMGLPFVSVRRNVREYADSQKLSIEEASRNLRYHFLFDQAERQGAQAVCVGHTADDQVETILMHFLRGTGLSGLMGMAYRSIPNPWNSKIALIRPLLGIFRKEVDTYIKERELHPSTDASNMDVTFYRNRLRHELIPDLEKYNPQFKSLILRMANVLHEDYSIIDEQVNRAWKNSIESNEPTYIVINLNSLLKQPLSIKRHIIRRAINYLRPGLRDLDFQTIERAIGLINQPGTSRQMDLIAKMRLILENGQIWIADWDANLPTLDWPQYDCLAETALQIPGTTTLSKSWLIKTVFESGFHPLLEEIQTNTDPFQAWIDFDRVNLPLIVRTRRPGDRMQPLGMGDQSVKISDLMVNLKLPLRARDKWPVILSGSDIVWVPGLRLSHKYRLSSKTKKIVHLSVVRN